MELLKAAGDSVAMDEVVSVLETDKVSVDVTADAPGTVAEVLVKTGQVVGVGAPLMKIISDGFSHSTENDVKDLNKQDVSSMEIRSFSPEPTKYVPSIQFKFGKGRQRTQPTSEQKNPEKSIENAQKAKEELKATLKGVQVSSVEYFEDTPEIYQRKAMSEEEIQAVMVKYLLLFTLCHD